HFREDFNDLKQSLKNAYAPLDPDADTRFLHSREEAGLSTEFSEALERVLQRANYDKVTDKGLQKALRTSSLFQVRLFVNLKDYEEVLLYTRGASRRSETLSEFFGLWKRKVRFTNFERVVLYLRIRPDMDSEGVLMHCPPGRTMIKLFQNVPEADLEMLFPNIRVGMRFIDKLMIGVPAVVSGAVVFSTKMGATLLLLGSLIGFWLGMSVEPVELDKAALLALAAGIGALGGYLWKQYSNFRNRKLKYTQALTENLYFKLLDNNAGVFHRVLDDAEESECKESLLALYFLLRAREPVTSAELDQAIERWFEERWHCSIDFEIADALGKLERLGMAAEQEGRWRPLRAAAAGPAAA
ncbi:MAG: TMEM143 family protein, partial [Halioglobus sp.]|nr:TMEM143 family protein [Halioglobus sp.]